MRWYQSLVFKNNVASFVATHVPLLGLIGLVVLWPDLLSPWTVLWTALLFTLFATVAVVLAQWHLFKPLRSAADGLKGFMSRGAPFPTSPDTTDEVGRLVTVLVQSLAHLDKSRMPLLGTGAMMLGEASEELGNADGAQSWLGLVEIDDSGLAAVNSSIAELKRMQTALSSAADTCVGNDEIALPWGRARMLLMLKGTPHSVRDRLEGLCGQIRTEDGQTLTASAALEPEGRGERARAAALQRLEHKMFSLRMEGRRAALA